MIARRRLIGLALALLALPGHLWARAAQRQVLAFHYGWYPGGRWPLPHPDRPQGGLYDSLDPAVIARQIDQARGAGITGFITSWGGPGQETDRALSALLAAAPEGFAIAPYIEVSGGSAGALAETLDALQARAADQPRWLRHEGRPVVFLFDRPVQQLGLEGVAAALARHRQAGGGLFLVGPANDLDQIAARRGLFDALHIYSLTFETDGWPGWLFGFLAGRFQRRWVQAQAGAAVTTATVLPGFDDRHLPDRTGERPVTDRRGGETYRRLWRAARAAGPDWVLIVSWNEWYEDSQIEPSQGRGTRDLQITAEEARGFLGD